MAAILSVQGGLLHDRSHERLRAEGDQEVASCPEPEIAFAVNAVIDRQVDHGRVVILVEPDQREWIVEPALLPPGWREGVWLRISLEGGCGGGPVFTVDHQATEEAKARIAAKLERLRERSRSRSGVPPP